MGSQPHQQPRQHDDVRHALDVSLVAVQVAVDTLAKVEDGDERLEMATAVYRELEELRGLVRQLEHPDPRDPPGDAAEVPPPRRP